MSGPKPALGRLLQLVALSAFAVGQPLLQMLAEFPGFLVAHRSAPGDVVLLALALLVAPPLVLFALARAAGLVSRRAEAIVHGACVAALTASMVLPRLGEAWPDAKALPVAASLILGALFAAGVARSGLLRGITELCAAGAPLFFILFLADADIRTLVFRAPPPTMEAPRVRKQTPVVMVIFDELPLSSLLDAKGRIDQSRFPAFARLAGHATWFRDATAVAGYTQQAVPAILTGRYPGTEPRLAIASEHPYSLFSMLAGSHELNVFESQMQLADPEQLPRPALARRMGPLLEDLSVVYLHTALPPSMRSKLPAVNETWRDFVGHGGAESASEQEESAGDGAEANTPPAYFREFVEAIGAHEGPALHFIHSTLPHRPWRYLPSGHVYFPYREHGSSVQFRTTSGEWWRQEACQRHLLQLQYVDRLLGELIDRLLELGLYDRSLVVVTADHGVAFWPDDNARLIGLSGHPEDILSVPLLVKQPHQERGRVDLRNAETVDVLPTIADLLEVVFASAEGDEEGFTFDGCSLFDPACLERPDKVAYWSMQPNPERMKELRFDADLPRRDESLRRKIAWFGEGLHRFGPYASLVGRSLASLDVDSQSAGRLTLDSASGGARRHPGEVHVPVRVSGLLELARERDSTPYVAVAMAGTIQTVVPAPVDGAAGRRVLAMLPEAALVPGSPPELFLVEGEPEGPRLLPIEPRAADPS